VRACLKKECGCVEDQPQRMASTSTRREFEACCGWSKTTQPRSGIFRQALRAGWRGKWQHQHFRAFPEITWRRRPRLRLAAASRRQAPSRRREGAVTRSRDGLRYIKNTNGLACQSALTPRGNLLLFISSEFPHCQWPYYGCVFCRNERAVVAMAETEPAERCQYYITRNRRVSGSILHYY
jgi:hypothetical protein